MNHKTHQPLAPNALRPAPAFLSSNELTLDGEWLKITPWGDFPNKVGVQRVTQPDGDQMVRAFNSLRGRLARAFMGLPIYVGHPDVEPDQYPDKRRYGKITDLESRADGLYGRIAWNDLGRTAIEQGHYLFNSPTWYLKREDRFVRPVELVSVGLTNTPQIPGDAWAKNEPHNEPPTESTPMPEWLQTLLGSAGLIASDASETDIQTAVAALVKLPARVTELETQLATAANERDTLRTDRRERELELAINTGRIAAADRAAWNAKLTADFTAHAAELRAKQPSLSTSSRLGNLGARKGEAPADKLTAMNEAVVRYAAAHQLDLATNNGHNTAYQGAKRQHPALFQ